MSRRQGDLFPELPSDKKYVSDYPILAAQWHLTKNGNKFPEDVKFGSNVRIWWVCEKGHEWEATPHNRTKGQGCPKCSHQTSKGEIRIYTELSALYDEVKSRHKIDGYEVDIFVPQLNTAIEYDGAFWHKDKDKKDKSKQAYLESIGVRLLRIRERPLKKISVTDILVSSRKHLCKFDLNKLVMEVGGEQGRLNSYLSHTNFLNERMFRVYLDYFPSPFPDKSLATINPELCKEWHPTKNTPLSPDNFTANSGHKVWWRCKKGHDWNASIDSRNGKGTGCPYCSATFKLASPDYNLSKTHPHLVAYFHPTKNGNLRPTDITGGAEKIIWWQCPSDENHEFERSPNHMSSSSAPELCPFCSGVFVSGKNCMATTNPEMAEIFHPTKNGKHTAKNIRAGSRETYWWQCHNGHEWRQSAFNIQRSLDPCPHCKTLLIQRPDVAEYFHPTKNGKLKVSDLTLWSSLQVWWQCLNNSSHVWRTSAATMVQPERKSLCPICLPTRVSGCMSEVRPDMAKAFHPYKNGQNTPRNLKAGTGKNLWWVCSNNKSHEWQASGDNLKRSSRPDLCPACRRKL